MVIKYQFFDEYGLLIHAGHGEWSTVHHDKYLDKVFKSEKMKSIKKVLSDMRFVDVKKAISEMSSITPQRSKVAHLDYINVFLVSDPINTVATHLYTYEQVSKGYNQNYCSTFKEVIKRLDLDISETELTVLLENLENKF